jgi:hypothetical protein
MSRADKKGHILAGSNSSTPSQAMGLAAQATSDSSGLTQQSIHVPFNAKRSSASVRRRKSLLKRIKYQMRFEMNKRWRMNMFL